MYKEYLEKQKEAKSQAQQWLDRNYPQEKRVNFKNLDISRRNLEGPLKLEGFSNLEKLDCSVNLITELSLDPGSEEKITKLNLRDNNFDEQDLTCFSRFVNLKKMYLGTTKERIQQGCYNRFNGSLEPLKDLSELEELSISNTGIDSGLEHLPESLEKIYCVNDLGISGGCEKIRKELKNYSGKTPF